MTATLARLVRLLVGGGLLLAGLFSPLSVGAVAASAGAQPATASGVIQRTGVVNVRRLAPATEHGRGGARPFHAAPRRAGGPARTTGIASVAPSTAAAQTSSVLGSFTALSMQQTINLFPSDQGWEPPDVMMAAGPNNIVEMVNSVLAVYSKSGALQTDADLNAFFKVPTGYSFSDPRIVYDTPSGRWFADGLSFDSTNDSQVYAAVSQTGDPSGNWTIYTLKAAANDLLDQPFLGTSDDKVVVTWNEYPGGTFFGSSTLAVIQKSDLIAGASLHVSTINGGANRFRLVPAISRSATTTEYVSYNTANFDPGQIGVLAVTGTPLQNNVTYTEQDLAVTPIAANVPVPQQPGGAVMNGDDLDNRFLNSVWQNGSLWISGNDGCTPAGDTTARTCGRLIQVGTTGATFSVLQDFDIGAAGSSIYYPAVGVDQAGDLVVPFSISSATQYPSAAVSTQAVGTTGALGPTMIIQAGKANYSGNRWGDYNAAAVDPANPMTVWAASEYATADSGGGNWGTAIAQIGFSAPTIGGKGFKLSMAPSETATMTWTGGTAQTGYEIARIANTGNTILPTSGPLPATATSFVDSTGTANSSNCYLLLPLNGSTPIGVSDLLCGLLHIHAGSAIPGAFAIQLNQSSTASLTWTAPGGQTGYVLITLPLNGAATTTTTLPATATSASAAIGNSAGSCYLLAAVSGSTAIGLTDAVCGIPGVSTLQTPAAAATAVQQAAARAQAATAQLRQASSRATAP